MRDTWQHSWLRDCATNRKVAGSIPEGVFEIFHWHGPSATLWPWGWLSLLTEVSTRDIAWGVHIHVPGCMVGKVTTFLLITMLSIFMCIQPLIPKDSWLIVAKYGIDGLVNFTRSQCNLLTTTWLLHEFVRLEQHCFYWDLKWCIVVDHQRILEVMFCGM